MTQRPITSFGFFFLLVQLAGCAACGSKVPCSKNSDCAADELCAAAEDGAFCVAAANEGEGEGEGEGEPRATLRLESGVLEGDERLELTLGWTLANVTGCALEMDGVATSFQLRGQSSAAYVVEQSTTLQIVCDQASSEALSLVVHDVSELEGPALVSQGQAITLSFTVEGVTACSVSTDGADVNLTQPIIAGSAGTFTDTADADKRYTLSCAGIEGDITRTFDLRLLAVTEVTPPPAILDWGSELALTVASDPSATCALFSTAPDGSDQRVEGDATVQVSGAEQRFTLAAPTETRAWGVQCSVGEASATSLPALVRLRPVILSFDAHIPNVEALGGTPNLDLLISVAGLQAGGSCAVSDGVSDTPSDGSDLRLTSGPAVAVYTLSCAAEGGDATPNSAGGWQAIWRDTTSADLALLAASRFAMRNNLLNYLYRLEIDLGLLEQVGGDLRIVSVLGPNSNTPTSILAPNLKNVGARFEIVDSNVATLAIPQLRSAVGLLLQSVRSLEVIDAPELRSLIGDLGFNASDCADLRTVDLPLLELGGDLLAASCPALESISAPVLAQARFLSLYANPQLTSLDVSQLVTLSRWLDVQQVGLTSVSLPLLETVAGGVVIASNPSLETLSLWALEQVGLGYESSTFEISSNQVLWSIITPYLRYLDANGSFTVSNNPALTCTEIHELYCLLDTRDATPTVSNNYSTSCPVVTSSC